MGKDNKRKTRLDKSSSSSSSHPSGGDIGSSTAGLFGGGGGGEFIGFSAFAVNNNNNNNNNNALSTTIGASGVGVSSTYTGTAQQTRRGPAFDNNKKNKKKSNNHDDNGSGDEDKKQDQKAPSASSPQEQITTPPGGSNKMMKSSSSASSSSCLVPYMGSDPTMNRLLNRIIQKRDPITRCKALIALSDAMIDIETSKPVQIDALRYYIRTLYPNKLYYDHYSTVRYEALKLLYTVYEHRLPKAVISILMTTTTTSTSTSTSKGGDYFLLGMLYTTQCDPSSDVRIMGRKIIDLLLFAVDNNNNVDVDVDNDASKNNAIRDSLYCFVDYILSLRRPSDLYMAIYATTASVGGSASSSGGSSGNHNSSHSNNNNNNIMNDLDDEQKDMIEERHEKLTGMCLDSIDMWLLNNLLQDNNNNNNKASCSASLSKRTQQWLKTITSSKTSIRQKTYRLLITISSKHPYILHHQQGGKDQTVVSTTTEGENTADNDKDKDIRNKIAKSLVQALSSEKDVGNIPLLLEAMLSFCHTMMMMQQQQQQVSQLSFRIILSLFVKPLCRLFKKACYGTPVRLWGPTLLPIISLFFYYSTNNNNNGNNGKSEIEDDDGDDNNNNNIIKQQEEQQQQQQQQQEKDLTSILQSIWDGRVLLGSSTNTTTTMSNANADDAVSSGSSTTAHPTTNITTTTTKMTNDQWDLYTAIAECTSFALLRPTRKRKRRKQQQQQQQRNMESNHNNYKTKEGEVSATTTTTTTTLVNLWLETLSGLLSSWSSSSSSSSRSSGRSVHQQQQQQQNHPRSQLIHRLARNLLQFQRQSQQSSNQSTTNMMTTTTTTTAFADDIDYDWFWKRCRDVINDDNNNYNNRHPTPLAEFVRTIHEMDDSIAEKEDEEDGSLNNHLITIFSLAFHQYLRPYRGETQTNDKEKEPWWLSSSSTSTSNKALSLSSLQYGSIPTDDIYELFHTIMMYCDPMYVLSTSPTSSLAEENEEGIKKNVASSSSSSMPLRRFIMNDLLRWMIIQTTSRQLSSNTTTTTTTKMQQKQQQPKPSDSSIQHVFSLLHLCLSSLDDCQNNDDDDDDGSKKVILWDSVLREIISAECDLRRLVLGLQTIVEEETTTTATTQRRRRRKRRQPTRQSGEVVNDGDVKDDDVYGWLRSETLDRFASEITMKESQDEQQLRHDDNIGKSSDDDDDNDDEEEAHMAAGPSESHNTLLKFVRLCLGLSPGITFRLVRSDVIRTWVDYLCKPPKSLLLSSSSSSSSSSLAVLEGLVEFVERKGGDESNLVSEDDIVNIMLVCWRSHGGTLFQKYVLSYLRRACHETQQQKFFSLASEHLDILLDQLMINDMSAMQQQHQDAAVIVKGWAERAWRLVQASYDDAQLAATSPRFGMLGLDNFDRWISHPKEMFLCSMELFRRMDDGSASSSLDRLSLLLSTREPDNNDDDDAVNLFIHILTSLSEANSNVALSFRARTRRDRCSKFLSAMMIRPVNHNNTHFLDKMIRKLVDDIAVAQLGSTSGNEHDVDDKAMKCVSVLSQLLDLRFRHVASDVGGGGRPEDIKEGQRVMYIKDPKDPSNRVSAIVVKVHHESDVGYYYTIRFSAARSDNNDDDGEVQQQERQTVFERLRIGDENENENDDDDDSGGQRQREISDVDITEDEWSLRSSMRDEIFRKLIKPQTGTMTTTTTMIVAELIHIISLQIGVGKDRGLGSTHYDLFKVVSLFEQQACDALAKGSIRDASKALWTLSVALGYGLNAPGSRHTIRTFRVDPTRLYESIIDHYGRKADVLGKDPTLNGAVLAWLTVSVETSIEYEATGVPHEVLDLLFRVASNALVDGSRQPPNGIPTLVTSRAIHEALVVCIDRSPSYASLEESREDAISQLVRSFVSNVSMADDASESDTAEMMHSFASRTFELARNNEGVGRALTKACSTSEMANLLSGALFDPSRRFYAFMMLDSLSETKEPLQHVDHNEIVLHDKTNVRFQSWTDGLEDDEAGELEEDVYIVAEWVPLAMMNNVETWGEEGFEEVDENTAIGRLLTWLCLLRFVDAAAPKDFRNRPAFVSYLSRCEAVSPMQNLALLYNESINDGSRKSRMNKSPAASSTASDTTETMMPSMDEMLYGKKRQFDLSKIASLVLYRTVEVLPSLSRRWWEDDCPKVYATAVQTFVEKFVAPRILKNELERVRRTMSERFGGMNFNASHISREVTASYVQDDFTLTVVIRLPAAFPFRSAEVDCSRTLGVPRNRWKRWSLQITLMLNNQGGTLQDALMLWKDNVDKEFDGVEPCPVCYSVLHVKTHKLPVLQCKTCSHRFHIDCLTQWFRSSGKNQCVLCQQPWQGTRIQ